MKKRKKKRMTFKVYLGESLSTIKELIRTPDSQDIISDLWDRGSLLSGIEICGIELDRVPILIRDLPKLPEVEFNSVKPSVIFVGNETSYNAKASKKIDIQRNWLLELSNGGKIPKKFFCWVFKDLRRRVGNKRIYDTLGKIELNNKKLKFLRYGTLNYDKLVNSLPLPYFMEKITPKPYTNTLHYKLDYVSLLIEIALAKYEMEEYTIIYVGRSNIVPHTIALIPLTHLNNELPQGHTLIYSITSMKRPYSSYKGEYTDRLISDIRKLGLQDMKFICRKLIFEKYGFLGPANHELEDLINFLKDHDIELIGRLGTWKELSISDILNHTSV
ncbi:MAG: hypothetical protein QXO98_03195 [Sulfolobales archaeon]